MRTDYHVPCALQPVVAAVTAHVQARRRRWLLAGLWALVLAWLVLAAYLGGRGW